MERLILIARWIIFCTWYLRLCQVYHQKNESVTDNQQLKMYISNTENRITFKIKAGYYQELLMPQTMKLLGSPENKVNKDLKRWRCASCSNYGIRALNIFIPYKLFGQLLDISPNNFIFFKKLNSEFSYMEVLFTDQILNHKR